MLEGDKIQDPPLSTAGFYKVCNGSQISGLHDLHSRIVEEIINVVGVIKGDEAAKKIRRDGLGFLHHVIDADDVSQIRDHVLEKLRQDLLRMAVQVGRYIFQWDQDFCIDDYLILRINLPYEVARLSPEGAENPGIGRVSPEVREIAAARRVKDPVYDPRGYHCNYPPAAWAHGPHIDSWAGHSRDGLNIWWAIGEVPAEAGMVLYPQVDASDLVCDRRSQYLQSGQPLPPPSFQPLAAGEMLIFDPEILHGTHLNVTDQTRVAVSLRLNANKPAFDPSTFYAREFWRMASDIENGNWTAVAHIKREDHLGPARPAPTISCPQRAEVDLSQRSDVGAGPFTVAPSDALADGDRMIVALPDRRVLLLRQGETLAAVDASCPHYKIDLMDGADQDGCIYCPACAVAFDLGTGRSACESLSLDVHKAYDDEGVIKLSVA